MEQTKKNILDYYHDFLKDGNEEACHELLKVLERDPYKLTLAIGHYDPKKLPVAFIAIGNSQIEPPDDEPLIKIKKGDIILVDCILNQDEKMKETILSFGREPIFRNTDSLIADYTEAKKVLVPIFEHDYVQHKCDSIAREKREEMEITISNYEQYCREGLVSSRSSHINREEPKNEPKEAVLEETNGSKLE